MKTTHKLGLSVLAVLATAAAIAPAAQAGTFTAAAYPATITGQNVGAHQFTTALGVMNCNVTFHGAMAAASSELTLTPNYGTNCGIENKVVHVDMNGCDYLFYAGETIAADEVDGSMDVKCPEGAEIDFEITSMPICHITVPEQLGLESITYTDRTGVKDVDADMNLAGMTYELDAGCALQGTFEGGAYAGTTTLASDNEGADGFTVD